MNIEQDIRWEQRLTNYNKALAKLDRAVRRIKADQFEVENKLNDLLLPYRIDLSIFCKIENGDLIDHVNRVGKLFYQFTKGERTKPLPVSKR